MSSIIISIGFALINLCIFLGVFILGKKIGFIEGFKAGAKDAFDDMFAQTKWPQAPFVYKRKDE
jgi:hypothetical protein